MRENGKIRTSRVTGTLLAANLAVSVCIIGYLVYQNASKDSAAAGYETQEKYTLYIGTNDKDTYSQIIPTEEAQDIVDDICSKYTDGYTRLDAVGGWEDESGSITHENTFIYEFYDVSEEQLEHIMDDVLVSLNQNSILVEKAHSVYTYYSG